MTSVISSLKIAAGSAVILLAAAGFGCSSADTISLVTQQPATPPAMASMRPAAPRLAVEPPEFSEFDRALTNDINAFLKRAPYAAMQKQRAELAQKEGGETVSVRQYCYSSDRSLEEVIAHYRRVMNVESEVPLAVEPLVPPLGQWTQVSELSGVDWEDGFLEQVSEAASRYSKDTARTAQFPPIEGPDEGATTSLKIFRPFVTPSTWEKIDRTVIIYTVTRRAVNKRP